MTNEKNLHLTLIAYRPNGIDTCRGCLMGTSDSDLNISEHRTIESIANQIQDFSEIDEKSDREYCSYDITILLDGREQWSYLETDTEEYSDFRSEVFESIHEQIKLVKELRKLNKIEQERLLAIKKEEERVESEKRKAEQAEKDRIAKLESDKKLYEELKKRFEHD